MMPPPGKICSLACSSHTVSRDVIPWSCQGSLSIGWIWSLLSREGRLWVTVLSRKRFTPRTSLCCKGTHAGMIISSAAWMGNLSDGKCALSPLYFPYCSLYWLLFGGLGGQGEIKFKDLMRKQFEQQFLTHRVNLPFCKLIFVTSYLYDLT